MSFAIGGPTSKWAKTSAKSANYTMLDTDEIGILLVTTGSSANVVINLPTLADNIDRVIEIVKVDSGTKFIEINPEGSETVRGSTTSIYSIQQGESIKLVATSSDWVLLGDPYRTVSALIDADASPTVIRQDGTWITSVAQNATGDWTTTVATGVFLSAPTIQATTDYTGPSRVFSTADITNATTTSFDAFVTDANTGLGLDRDFSVTVTGKK